jgi:acetyl-CoA acyltransferase
VHATTREGLEKLQPVLPGGTITYGGQTHPADGHAAMFVCTREQARALSTRPELSIELLAFGQARVEKAHMPLAPVPAARAALKHAGVDSAQVTHVKTHNPFVVNDIVLSREMGFALERINRYGCSLVWGHPQGPTGLRSVIELVEEMVQDGGGIGLFTGCAAGDSAMSVVVKVDGVR